MKKSEIYTLGLMSGTSVDAIDASLLKVGDKNDELLQHLQFPFDGSLREEILALIRNPSTNLPAFTRLHYAIGQAFAEAAEQSIKAALRKKLLPGRSALSVIGSHGQTVFHDPDGKRTLQIGEASLIAALTGVTVVSDFRTADTASGGEGAPLLPFYHRRLFSREAARGIAVHNLGGISNFTYIGPRNTILALDTGPANCLIDGAIQKISGGTRKFDGDGALAKRGTGSEEMLSWLMHRPDIEAFRRRRAPKSTGRELFSHRLLEAAMAEFPRLSPEDLLSTFSHFTVEMIRESYRKEVLDRKLPLAKVVLAGGGAGNSFLLSLLREALPSIKFFRMEELGFSSQALESQAFGFFAWKALQGEPITFPTATGAKRPAVCGKISPGENWKTLRKGKGRRPSPGGRGRK